MPIEGVIFEYREADHEDERRVLRTAFNGDLGDFVARQAKFAVMKQSTELGGHYHSYRELFYMQEGEATFNLKDTETKEERTYHLKKSNRLLIPAFVAHKAFVLDGSILAGFTESAYISPELNDHKYEF